MDITCISDLHGYYPELEGGDLLIVAGDIGAVNSHDFIKFKDWMVTNTKKYKKQVIIAGNHDNFIQNRIMMSSIKEDWDYPTNSYLEDSGCEFEGLKIWGSPWTKTFPGMNPKAMAFTVDTEEQLAEKWALIPDDTDILVTHSPPHGIYDQVRREHTGSLSLRNRVLSSIGPKLHVFGHIHEYGGKSANLASSIVVNAAIMNEVYDPVHKPVRVIL